MAEDNGQGTAKGLDVSPNGLRTLMEASIEQERKTRNILRKLGKQVCLSEEESSDIKRKFNRPRRAEQEIRRSCKAALSAMFYECGMHYRILQACAEVNESYEALGRVQIPAPKGSS